MSFQLRAETELFIRMKILNCKVSSKGDYSCWEER